MLTPFAEVHARRLERRLRFFRRVTALLSLTTVLFAGTTVLLAATH